MLDEPGVASDAQHDDRPSLFAMVARRARRTSDGALAGCAGSGLVALALLIAARPRWGALLLPLIALGAFGAWGIADRELVSLRSRTPPPRALTVLEAARWIAAAAGTVAALAAALWLMSVALGPLIS